MPFNVLYLLYHFIFDQNIPRKMMALPSTLGNFFYIQANAKDKY
jgi:hypothetical protein